MERAILGKHTIARGGTSWVKQCPHCRFLDLSPAATACPHCGRSVPLPTQQDYDDASDRIHRTMRTGPYRPPLHRRLAPWFWMLWGVVTVYGLWGAVAVGSMGGPDAGPNPGGATAIVLAIGLPWIWFFAGRQQRKRAAERADAAQRAERRSTARTRQAAPVQERPASAHYPPPRGWEPPSTHIGPWPYRNE